MKKKVSVIKEEKTFKNKQNETKQEKNEIVDNKDIVKEVIKPELNEKQKKSFNKTKEQKAIKKKSIDENVKKKQLDIPDATQTISKLHLGLKKIKDLNTNVFNKTKKLIHTTYDTERMLNMIIGDIWQNQDDKKKKK